MMAVSFSFLGMSNKKPPVKKKLYFEITPLFVTIFAWSNFRVFLRKFAQILVPNFSKDRRLELICSFYFNSEDARKFFQAKISTNKGNLISYPNSI